MNTQGGWAGLVEALKVQARVIHALMLREMKTRYGKHKLGFFWALTEPVFFIGMFAVFYTLMGRSSQNGMPVLSFLLTGILGYMLFRDTMQQTIQSVGANRALLTFPQVTLFDLVLARVLVEFAVSLVVFALLVAAAIVMREEVRIENPLGVVSVLVLFSLLGTGLGVGFCALTNKFPSVQQVLSVLLGRPLFFTSGLFFTAESLPYDVRDILLWNPLLSLTALLRSFYFFGFESQYVQIQYSLYWVFGSLAWGLLMLSAFRRSLHSPG